MTRRSFFAGSGSALASLAGYGLVRAYLEDRRVKRSAEEYRRRQAASKALVEVAHPDGTRRIVPGDVAAELEAHGWRIVTP